MTGAAVIARVRVLRPGRTLSVCQGDACAADDLSRLVAPMREPVVVAAR